MKALEDRAHAHRVLLSSDAMRRFIEQCVDGVDRIAFLDQVLSEARVTYPTEDGWVVLNAERMMELCEKRHDFTPESTDVAVDPEKKAAVAETVTVPTGSGSMAEAIVTSNVAAAYALAEARPMVALADAAADFDALYRRKKGEKTVVSDLLEGELTSLTLEQLEIAISALTGALDGTYTDEASAVKMAVLKAVKALS